MTLGPKIGQRVRFVGSSKWLRPGALGTISAVNGDAFVVARDEGGFHGWTTFEQWAEMPADAAPIKWHVFAMIANEETLVGDVTATTWERAWEIADEKWPDSVMHVVEARS